MLMISWREKKCKVLKYILRAFSKLVEVFARCTMVSEKNRRQASHKPEKYLNSRGSP